MQEEVTVGQGVPLPDDICSFTEVSQTLNILMLLGSKSECGVQSQAKGIPPNLVVWCWHNVAVICLSGTGRDGGIRLRSHASPVAATVVKSFAGLRGVRHFCFSHMITIIYEVPLHIIRNCWEEERSSANSFCIPCHSLPPWFQHSYDGQLCVKHQTLTQALTKVSSAFLLMYFLQNQRIPLSLHGATAQKKKRAPSSEVPSSGGHESQWANVPIHWKNSEAPSIKFFRAPIAHDSNQLNKVSLLGGGRQKITLLDFLSSLFHLLSSSLCFLKFIFSKPPAPWLILRLCHWRYPTKALFQPEKWWLFCCCSC